MYYYEYCNNAINELKEVEMTNLELSEKLRDMRRELASLEDAFTTSQSELAYEHTSKAWQALSDAAKELDDAEAAEEEARC